MKMLLVTALLAIGLIGASPTPSPSPDASPKPVAIVHMVGFLFNPETVTIHAGQAIEFINDDDVTHSAVSLDKSWSSGDLQKGESWIHVFAKRGTFPYVCAEHVFMKATIVVK